MAIGGTLFGVGVAAIAGLFAGGALFAAGPFTDFPGGPAAAILGGLGLMSGATAVGAVVILVCIGLVNALVWYARLHYRLLKPALGAPRAEGAVP